MENENAGSKKFKDFKKRFYIAEILMIIGALFLILGVFIRHHPLFILLLIAGAILTLTGGFLENTKIKWYWLLIIWFMILLLVIFIFFSERNAHYRCPDCF
jgi:energy-coupling factor transporter transmembrane protein EcfT